MKPLFFHSLRENYKFLIWDYIDKVHNTLKWISIGVSSLTIAVIAFYYGFPQTAASALTCKILIHCSLIFYILNLLEIRILKKKKTNNTAKCISKHTSVSLNI